MKDKSELRPGRIFAASPWIFGAACALLTLIIGVFAVSNYQREKKLMSMALVQEGQAVLSLVSSGARAAIRGEIMRGEPSGDAWLEAVQQVIDNGAEHPGIVSLFLVDHSGLVLAHNDPGQLKTRTDQPTFAFLEGLGAEGPPTQSRITSPAEDQDSLFQIAAPFNPIGFRDQIPSHFREMARSRMGRMMRERELPSQYSRFLQDIGDRRFYLVAELDMADYRQSVRKQFLQIVILSVVLLLVGLGGLLSLITLQGLRGSQMRLKRMSAFTDVLVSSLPVGLIALGKDGRIRTCNDSACKMVGLPDSGVEGTDPGDILPQPLLDMIPAAAVERVPLDREISLVDGSGLVKPLHVTRVDIEDSEQHHSGTMLLIQDLSKLRELEIELQRSERHAALGKMAAGVAHELRNPLSSIKGLAVLLKSRFTADRTGRETSDLLVSEVERLNRSISELLDYARPEVLNRSPADIDEVVRKAVLLVSSDAEAAGVTVEPDYQAGGHLIELDKDKITQVLLNLFLNGLQAMAGGGQLSIRTGAEEHFVTVEIRDSGCGIRPDLVDKVFDPYFTTKNDGTGLGLSLSAKIIEDHRGTITLASRVGQGTTVTIRLPLQRDGSSGLPLPSRPDGADG